MGAMNTANTGLSTLNQNLFKFDSLNEYIYGMNSGTKQLVSDAWL